MSKNCAKRMVKGILPGGCICYKQNIVLKKIGTWSKNLNSLFKQQLCNEPIAKLAYTALSTGLWVIFLWEDTTFCENFRSNAT